MWFLTIDPLIGISVFIAKLSKRRYCWRVFQAKSKSLTYTIASSCVCTSPLAVMTIEGLHDFVKVSISAEFKSFLLIMCIDAPESTTNSRSSGLRFDGADTYFPKVRRMLLIHAPLILEHFWPASTLLHGHLALATLSLPETDPQIFGALGLR